MRVPLLGSLTLLTFNDKHFSQTLWGGDGLLDIHMQGKRHTHFELSPVLVIFPTRCQCDHCDALKYNALLAAM